MAYCAANPCSTEPSCNLKPFVNKLDDGSLLIEWATKNERFMISIEPDLKESSWCFVAKERWGFPMLSESGYLPKELLELLDNQRKDKA